MRKTKITCILLSLFTVLLFPAMPQAALEYYVVNMNLVDAAQVEHLSENISLFSIYTASALMTGCAFGMMVFILWLVRNLSTQVKCRDYRAW